jgi:hypothetical protein
MKAAFGNAGAGSVAKGALWYLLALEKTARLYHLGDLVKTNSTGERVAVRAVFIDCIAPYKAHGLFQACFFCGILKQARQGFFERRVGDRVTVANNHGNTYPAVTGDKVVSGKSSLIF